MINPDKKVTVQVKTNFLPEHSDLTHSNYIWSYDITLTNESDAIIQLLNRFWKIKDIAGKEEEVRGPGVIGLQPIIKPGKSFTYSSFCHLFVSEGSMEGEYEMQTLDEEKFFVAIPKFILKVPPEIYLQANSSLH